MRLAKQKAKSPAAISSDPAQCSRLQKATEIFDLILKFLSCGAIIAAGIWACFQFDLGGGTDWMANITIDAEVLPYSDKTRMVVIHVKTKNPRPVRLEIEKANATYNLVVKKIPEGLKEGTTIDETMGNEIAKFNLLNEEYDLSPNAEFDNMKTVIVATNTILLITADLEQKNGTLASDGKPDNDFVSISKVIHIDEK